MDFSMRLARAFGMPPRVEAVAVRDVSMMRRLFVRTRFGVLCRLGMVMRRLAVVFGGGVMMLDDLFDFGHSLPLKVVSLTSASGI